MSDYEWVFTAGCRRTGSTVHYHLTREILEHSGKGKGFGAIPGGGIDPQPGWNIYRATAAYKGIKLFRTHRPTDQVVKVLNRSEPRDKTRCIYIYRDDRDSIVSVMERDNVPFQHLTGAWFKNRVLIDKFWRDRNPVMISRYEDNIARNKIDVEARKIADYLNIEIDAKFTAYLQDKYNREAVKSDEGMYEVVEEGWAVGDGGFRPFLTNHIQSGEWGRWIDYFSETQKETLDKVMGSYLKERGYPLYSELKTDK